MRQISAEGINAAIETTDHGAAPMLQWIDIEKLMVDDAYQRPIRGDGRRNVAKIAKNFRWSRFAPVVVSPIEGDRYAIVDGQHRTTAALIAGLKQVPCQIIVASPTEQAAAFAAINGNVTRMHRMALHRAAAAAGDPAALAINAVARKAGVVVLAYPKSELNQEPGETMAVGTIGQCIKTYGEAIVTLALRCVTQTRNRVKGGLISPVIAALCAVISRLPPSVRKNETGIIATFDKINIIREYGKSCGTERQPGDLHLVRVGRTPQCADGRAPEGGGMSVYFIRDGSGMVKIGRADDPWQRLRDLQVASPHELQLVRVVQGGSKVEAWFHRRFAANHVRGEWFWFASEMLTIAAPDEVPVERRPHPAQHRSIGDSLREADRLGILSERMRRDYAPFLEGRAK